MTAAALMSRHSAAWQAATVHPLLAGVLLMRGWPTTTPILRITQK